MGREATEGMCELDTRSTLAQVAISCVDLAQDSKLLGHDGPRILPCSRSLTTQRTLFRVVCRCENSWFDVFSVAAQPQRPPCNVLIVGIVSVTMKDGVGAGKRRGCQSV